MSFDDYNNVIQPKVTGAWNLHNALSAQTVDFFTFSIPFRGEPGAP